MKVDIHVEVAPYNSPTAVSFVNDVSMDEEGVVSVYLDKEKTWLVLYMLASLIGSEITIDGKLVEFEL